MWGKDGNPEVEVGRALQAEREEFGTGATDKGIRTGAQARGGVLTSSVGVRPCVTPSAAAAPTEPRK